MENKFKFVAKEITDDGIGKTLFGFNSVNECNTEEVTLQAELESRNLEVTDVAVVATDKYDYNGWFEAIYDPSDEDDREAVVEMIDFLDETGDSNEASDVCEWAIHERGERSFWDVQHIVEDAEVVDGDAEDVCEAWLNANDYWRDLPDAVCENIDWDGMVNSLEWSGDIAEISNGSYIINADDL